MLERYVKGMLLKAWERGWLLTSFVSEINQKNIRSWGVVSGRGV